MDNEDYVSTNHYEIEDTPNQMIDGNRSLWPLILTATLLVLVTLSILATLGVLQASGGPYTMLYAFILPSIEAGVGAAATFTCFADRRWIYLTISALALAFLLINSPWFAIVTLFVWVVFVIS